MPTAAGGTRATYLIHASATAAAAAAPMRLRPLLCRETKPAPSSIPAGLVAADGADGGQVLFGAGAVRSCLMSRSAARLRLGATVGLIEVMKVFASVKTETAGVIERILVSSGEFVEFGQPLFLLRPN